MEQIIEHPSPLNNKIIQCEITFMMLTDEELNSAIDALFSATKENCDPKSEFFQKLTIDDLPDSD